MNARLRHASLSLLALGLAVAGTVASGGPSGPAPAAALASTVVPAVDTNDRNAVNALYQGYYAPATPSPGWTGDVGSCQPGAVSTDYQLAVVRRINYFRALAGVRADTTLATERTTVAQAAALMMSAANQLNHSPTSTWPCFSADGQMGAGASDLALGVTGPDAIDLYMRDPGANNTTVGHRWWLLQPAASTFASGNVPANGAHMAANSVYVFDVNTGAPWPAVRDPAGMVLWPPRGYVPRSDVPDRWSVFDDGTDFSAATVTATVDGVPVAVALDASSVGTLVWRLVGWTPAASGDATVRIQIRGAVDAGRAVNLDYTSTVFDPSPLVGVPGPPPTSTDYRPVVPERLLDTRPGGPQTGYAGAKPVAGQVIELQVTGAGATAVPADAGAVALNVTVTEPATATYVTVWPCGQARPTASNLNVGAGQTLPNLVMVRLGAGGRVCLFTQAAAHLIADLNGWFPAGSTYRPVTPERLLDTRPGGPQVGYGGAKPGAGRVLELQLTGVGRTAMAATATAAVLNVTVTDPDAATYVTVWPCGQARPTASNLNAGPGQTVANLVVARVGAGGKVCLFTQGPANLVADLSGWFPAGTGYMPMTPDRLVDTRPATAVGGRPVRLAAGETRRLAVGGAGPQSPGRAVVLNVTAVDPTGPGFVTVWPCGAARPTASNLNLTPGVVAANLVVAAIDTTGEVCFYATTPVDLVVDRNGDF